MSDFSPHQQKIIKRYYRNFDAIKHQRLSELTTELYLADGKKSERLWKQVSAMLTALEFPPSRIEHLLQKKDPALLPGILKELEGRRAKILPAGPASDSFAARFHRLLRSKTNIFPHFVPQDASLDRPQAPASRSGDSYSKVNCRRRGNHLPLPFEPDLRPQESRPVTLAGIPAQNSSR